MMRDDAGWVNLPGTTFEHIWWILSPYHAHHCDDCKHLAANSPYDAPGRGGNQLEQTPGDGRTACGGDCTCLFSYSPPGPNNPQLAALQPTHLADLLRTYDHAQVRFIEDHGLERKQLQIWDHIAGLVLDDTSLVKATEYQYFITSPSGDIIELWEYPSDIPFPPDGKWRRAFEERQKRVGAWNTDRVRWVLNDVALPRYERTAPAIPTWREDEARWSVDAALADNALAAAQDAAQTRGYHDLQGDRRSVRPSYHHAGYDVQLLGSKAVTYKNGNSREQRVYLLVHVVQAPSGDRERFQVRTVLEQ
jgi:hypothetical protein